MSVSVALELSEFPAIIQAPNLTQQHYLIGTEVLPGVIFRDPNGQVVQPSDVTFKYRTPDGVLHTLVYGTDPELLFNAITKQFTVTVDTSQVGEHFYRWEASNSHVGVGERKFTIIASSVL